MAVLFYTAKKPKANVYGRHFKTFVFEALDIFYIYFLNFCVNDWLKCSVLKSCCCFCFSTITLHYVLLVLLIDIVFP